MNSFTIEFEGTWPSVNDLRNKQWRDLNGLKNSIKKKYTVLVLQQKPQKMNKFHVDVKYNSRLDPDNVTLKYFIDSLKGLVVVDDNKKYFRGFSITPDESLKHNTYIVTVTEV
jgi:hypothetical protein